MPELSVLGHVWALGAHGCWGACVRSLRHWWSPTWSSEVCMPELREALLFHEARHMMKTRWTVWNLGDCLCGPMSQCLMDSATMGQGRLPVPGLFVPGVW